MEHNDDEEQSEGKDSNVVQMIPSDLGIQNGREPIGTTRTSTSDAKIANKIGIAVGFVTIVSICVGGFWQLTHELSDIHSDITALQTEMNSVKTDVESIHTDIAGINEEIEKINSYLYEDGGVKDQLGDINHYLNGDTLYIAASEKMTAKLAKMSIESRDQKVVNDMINSSDSIGTDQNGNVYLAKDLIGKTILLSYLENDKKVYFLGQYNEKYHWDGYCITNAFFLDGTLFGICESDFKDGERTSYKSFCMDNENKDAWLYSDKKCDEDGNKGKNILANFRNDPVDYVAPSTLRVSDMLYVEQYMNSFEPRIIKYYDGYTVNGSYNDQSGEAVGIFFDEDGTVRTLYVGRFSDGKLEDDTGNAWDISYNYEMNTYMYNKGNFHDNKSVKNSGIHKPVTTKEIEDIISGYDFGIEIKWKEN